MYDYFIKAISIRGYDLTSMLERIKISWAAGEISEEERSELERIAKESANPEQSLPGISERVAQNERAIKEIIARLDAIESPGEEETDEYPEFVPPTGAHDAYYSGDKITFNGKKYVCVGNAIVHDPDTYPAGWKEVEDE